MRLILIRHAEREHLPSIADNAQVLTSAGRTAARHLGQYLKELKLPPHLTIYSSDYARALETAQLLNLAFPQPLLIQTMPCLRPEAEGSVTQILELIKSKQKQEYVILVGHQPELEQLGAYFTGHLQPLKKAEALCIHITDTDKGKSKVEWRYRAK